MAYNLGNAQGDIQIIYDNRGMAVAVDSLGNFVDLSDDAGKSMDKTEKKSGRLSKSLLGLGRGFLVMSKYVTIASVGLQGAVSAVNALAFVIASLAPAVGAGLATLPAIILSAVSAMLVFKSAMAGVGDALKAAVSGDAEKLAEAVKNLAPSARAFAVAIGAATKALKPMQQAIQQALFAGLAPQVGAVAAALRGVQGEAVGVAGQMGAVGQQFGLFLQSTPFIEAVRAGLNAVRSILASLAPGIRPLLTGFADLAKHGAELVSGSQRWAGVLSNVGAFLSNLNIAQLFRNASLALAPFIALARDLGTILGTVFAALNQGGGGALGILTSLVGAIAQFAESEAGTAALNALGLAISTIAGTAGSLLLAVLKAIGPAITALAPLFSQLATTLGSLLTPIIEALSPILTEVAEALSGALGSVLPPLADAIAMVASALLPFISMLVTDLAPIIGELAPVIGAFATALGIMLAAALTAVMPLFEAFMPVLQQIATDLLPQLIPLILTLAEGFAAAAPVMLLMANIVGGVLIAAMKVLIPVLSFVIQAFTEFGKFMVWIIGPIAAFIGKWTEATKIVDIIRTVFFAIVDIIMSRVQLAISVVRSAIGFILTAFSGLSSLASTVGAYFGRMRDAIAEKVNSAVAFVRGIPGQIKSALGNLGSLLFNAGQEIINGLVNGIRSLAGRAADAARAAVAGIPAAVKGLLGISSPSKVAMALGREVPRGLALGILDTADLVRRATEQAAAQVAIAMPTDFSGQVSAAVSASVSARSGGGLRAAPTAPVSVAGPTVNQTVYAPQNMNSAEVANLAAARIAFSLSTGAT